MWKISNSDLPSTPKKSDISGAAIARIDLGGKAAPIARIDLSSQTLGITNIGQPTTQSLIVPVGVNGQYTVALPADVVSIDWVSSNGISFTPTLDESSPQPGEFIWNGGTTLTIYTNNNYPLITGFLLKVGTQTTASIPTSEVPHTLFSAFYGLPVVGQISWSCSVEQHPTGSINLIVAASSISTIRERFKKGAEIEFAGIGFSVSNEKLKLLNTNNYPDGCYELNISLTGKWNRKKYTKPVTYKPFQSSEQKLPYEDSDCGISSNTGSIAGTPTTVSIRALAHRNGASFTGYSNNWSVPIPRDATRDATTDWIKEAQELLRVNGCYIDYNSPSAVQAKRINNVASWSYRVPEVDITLQGDTDNSSGYQGYAAEYPNTKLEGDFEQEAIASNTEVTHGNKDLLLEPKWKEKKPERKVVETGKDATSPPADVVRIKSISQCFFNSGETRTHRKVTTEDSHPILEEEWIYGLLFNSIQCVDTATGALDALAAPFWQICQYKRTEHLYDKDTGYYLGCNISGYRYVQLEQETDALEAYGNRNDTRALEKYRLRPIALEGKTRRVLRQYRDFYKDVEQEQQPYVTYKECNRDGTSTWRYKLDPTYVEPMLVAEEMTYLNAFISMVDPEDPPKYKIAGERTFQHVKRTILPSKNTVGKTNVFSLSTEQGQGDRYIEETIQDSAQNGGFKEKNLKESSETKEGRPEPATRKPLPLEREKPEEDKQPAEDTAKYEYRLTTPGYNAHTSPVDGSTSFSKAKTVNEALLAAKTDLKMRDIQESISYDATIPFNAQIRPLDKVTLTAGGETYRCRVCSFKNTVNIQGVINDAPMLTSEGTELTCGIDREIQVTLTKVPAPLKAKPSQETLQIFLNPYRADLTLGELITNFGKTRGNF